MATAQIRIDQPAHPSQIQGVPGRSRRDIVRGQSVQLRNANDSGVRSHRWQILSQPSLTSPDALSNPNSAVPTFTPNAEGTYRIRLTVNEGRQGEVFTILVVVLDSLGNRVPAAGEEDEANWLDETGFQNTRGWQPDLERYLLSTRQQFDFKGSVRAATVIAGTLATDFEDGDVIDTVTLAELDEILIKNQAAQEENGKYIVQASGAPIRSSDADEDADVTAGLFVIVEEGSLKGTGWVLTTPNPIIVGTTGLVFSQFGGGLVTWAASLALGNVSGSVNPTLTAGDSLVHDIGANGSGSINWDNATNPRQGSLTYDDAVDEMLTRVEDVDQVGQSVSAFAPVAARDNAIDLGVTATRRFRNAFLSAAMFLAGAVVADAPITGNDLVIGGGASGVPAGLTINVNNDTDGYIHITSGGLTPDIFLRGDVSANTLTIGTGNASRMRITSHVLPGATSVTSLGQPGDAWLDVHVGTAYLAGADGVETGPADGANIIVGNTTSTTAAGMTFLTTSAGTGSLGWSDVSGFMIGGLSYSNVGNILAQHAGGAVRTILDDNGSDAGGPMFGPNSGQTVALGTVAVPWSFVNAGAGLFAGATEANGALSAKSIVFGDGAGSYGISAFIGTGSIGRFGVTDVSGGAMRGGFQMNTGGDIIILIAAGTAVTSATSAAFSPFSDGDKTLGLTGSRWSTVFAVAGDFTGNVTLNSANPIFTVGNALGSPVIIIDKLATGIGVVRWNDAGVRRWELRVDDNEDWKLQRYDSGGSIVEDSITVTESSGLVSLANNLTLNSATAIATIGTGAGAAKVSIRGVSGQLSFVDDNNPAINWRRSSDSNRHWDQLFLGSSSDNLQFRRFNVATDSVIDIPLQLDNASGNVAMENNLTVGRVSPLHASVSLDVLGNDVAAVFTDTDTDASDKNIRIGFGHYTNAEEPLAGIYAQSTVNAGILNFGGGTSLFNAATTLNFFTAANSTTPTGTNRGSISSSGAWTIGADGVAGTHSIRASGAIFRDNATDANNKVFLFRAEPYTNAHGAWAWGQVVGNVTSNLLRLGGEGSADGATAIEFYTSPTLNAASVLAGSFDAAGDFNVVNQLLIAGATSGVADAGANDLSIGARDSADYGMTFHLGAGGNGCIAFDDGTNNRDGAIEYGSASRFLMRVANSNEYVWNTTEFRPVANNGNSLGSDTIRFLNSFVAAGHFGGGSVGDATAQSNDLVIGTGTGDFGIFLHAGTGFIEWGDVAGTRAASIRYINSAEIMLFNIEGSDRLQIETAGLMPSSSGLVGVGSPGAGFNSFVLAARSDHVNTPAAASAEIWLRDDTKNTLMVTTGDGSDRPLSLMETVDGEARGAQIPSSGGATKNEAGSGIGQRSVVTFGPTADEEAYWICVMPRDYQGGGFTVRLRYSGNTGFGAGDSIDWNVGVERHSSDVSMSSLTTTDTAGNDTPGVAFATDDLRIFDIAVSGANDAAIVAGEGFLLKIERLGSTGGDDDYADSAHLFSWSIIQDP